jgi:D-psicose/D-tagatose/L-ribulose 3-epimerase
MAIEERNIEQAIKTVGHKLVHVQVSENYRGTPGTGQTPWHLFKSGLSSIHYNGAVSIESFTPEVKELAGAVCIWKNLAESQDGFAQDGIDFLKKLLND